MSLKRVKCMLILLEKIKGMLVINVFNMSIDSRLSRVNISINIKEVRNKTIKEDTETNKTLININILKS